MITFDCPICGKHYTFSDRFGGHSLVCTGCRSSLVVPKIEENSSPVIPPPLPLPTQSDSLLPIPPLPTSPQSVSSSAVPQPPELSVSPTDDHDELAILAYVFEEKQQEKEKEKTSPPPPPIYETQNKKDEPEIKKTSSFLYRGGIVLSFLCVVGIVFFLIFYIDWRSPDPRPKILEKIVQHKIQTLVNAKNKEIEAETLRLRSLELWNQAEESIDALIVTLGRNDIKQENKEMTAEQRLNDLHKMIQTAVHQAAETEINRKNTIYNAKIYRAECQFFEECEIKLQEQIRQFPNDRSHTAMPVFDTENQTIPAEEPIMLDSDWTENHFGRLNFPEMTEDRFYAAFDAIKRLYGDKSLRVTALEQKSITVSFFENVAKNNLITPKNAGCFAFSIRFPPINDLLRIGSNADIGKIGAFRVRFVYPSGHIDFETVSPRYCNALFYDACGTFIPVEFPLTGDSFWKRTDHFEGSKTEWNETPIDHIEISLTPLSNQTTFWLDGIALTEKISREPYDLLRAETQQTEIRNRVKEFFKLHHSSSDSNNNSNNNLSDNNLSNNELFGDKISVQNSGGKLPKSTEMDSMRRLFQWVLQDAQGKIHLRRGNRVFLLNSQQSLPEFDETIIIEEIDLTGFRNLTDEHLNQLSNLKTIKRLNLSRTALKNEHLIKLTTLTSLESLNLAENELTFEGLPAIRTLKQLKELNLDGIKTGLDGIDALGTLISLRSLSLSRSGMDNNDLIYLLPLAELETINLSSTKVGDKGLPIFRVFTELRSLDLSETRITDNGLVSLIPLRNLRELKLNNTVLSNACLESLGKIQGLETISVANTAITKDGVRQELSPAKF
ncbi:MAG: hypothetical protein LBC02_08910, partial [Planctomycetaceae bacterium]|nr:hypothetical protein [Planctomycetaceae bacterium]